MEVCEGVVKRCVETWNTCVHTKACTDTNMLSCRCLFFQTNMKSHIYRQEVINEEWIDAKIITDISLDWWKTKMTTFKVGFFSSALYRTGADNKHHLWTQCKDDFHLLYQSNPQGSFWQHPNHQPTHLPLPHFSLSCCSPFSLRPLFIGTKQADRTIR